MSILHPTSVSAGNHKSSKLGFSIDSIVGAKSSSGSPPPLHPHPGILNPALSLLANDATQSHLRDSLTISPTDLSVRHGFSAPNSAVSSIASAQEALRKYHNSLINQRRNSLSPQPEGHNKSDASTRNDRSRSPSRSPPSDEKRGSSASPVSPQPSGGVGGIRGHRMSPTSASPTSPSLVRPIPTSLGGSGGGLPLTAQSYLDHLATFKALYDQNAGSQGAPGSPVTSGAPVMPNGPPAAGSPLHHNPFHPGIGGPLGPLGIRPPGHLGGAPPGMPHLPFLGGAGGGPGAIPPQIPREYPLYPWFISRRFPGGPALPEFLLPFRKPKRIRTAFSPSQLLKLEQAFEKNQYVVGAERKELAKHLTLSETQAKVWFQNRRTKHKREQQEQEQQEQQQQRKGQSMVSKSSHQT